MCLAIFKPRGVCISKKYLRNGFESNDHGAGFAVATKEGELKIFKGYMTWKDFYTAYKPFAGATALIHFRLATHGDMSHDNCHPFDLCNGTLAMVHNGIISMMSDDRTKSDTRLFCETVLEPLLKRVPINEPALKLLVEAAIGSGNKVALLHASGAHVIFNEGAGEWCNGAWFSNTGYKYRSLPYGGYYGTGGYTSDGFTQEYFSNKYGDKHVAYDPSRGKTTVRYLTNGHTKRTDDPWDDYAEANRQKLTGDESCVSTDEECECGSNKIMTCGMTPICYHCGIDRPDCDIIDTDSSSEANDLEAQAVADWERDQRKIILMDNGK